MPRNALRCLVTAAAFAVALAGSARAAEVIGPTLPIPTSSTLTGGGPPNFADTFVTPYTSASGGLVVTWKAQFLGGLFPPIGPDQGGPFGGGPTVPAGMQLKVFRHVSPTLVQVVAAGAVHDPRPILAARLPGYPFFLSADSVVEFSDPGLVLQPGDLVGVTIMSDPAIGRYAYLLAGSGDTPLVQRDVPVGGTIDVADMWTASLPWPPAVEVDLAPLVTTVQIDVKPGSDPNSINLGSNGVVPVAILSSATFDATTVDPSSIAFAGAPVARRPNGTLMASVADVDGDGLPDLVVQVPTSALELSHADTEASLVATTYDGTRISGTNSVRVVG